MRRPNRIAVATALFLSCVSAAARPAADSETWVHAGGKVRGVIITLTCEPVPDARLTFNGKRLTQLVTPDSSGRFIVELPAGRYEVSVTTPGQGEVSAAALLLDQTRKGDLRLSIDTGRSLHPGCFETPDEHLLVPGERGVVGDTLVGRPPAPKP